ncbi:hypothetical protein SAMN05444162_2303 [Paenibacillaceae bacterium GAS479]|nr:hypothetical protein SAMN05444162_2303 [Paenibacillaceae bacterium GAS479]
MSEESTCSRYSGSRIGMVLVLFILLVIVTSMFNVSSREDDPPIESAASRFQIINETSVYTFNLTSPTNIPALPSTIRSGQSLAFPISGTVTASYDIRSSGVRFGSFSVTMNEDTGITRAGTLGNFSAYINNNNFYAYTLSVYSFA